MNRENALFAVIETWKRNITSVRAPLSYVGALEIAIWLAKSHDSCPLEEKEARDQLLAYNCAQEDSYRVTIHEINED